MKIEELVKKNEKMKRNLIKRSNSLTLYPRNQLRKEIDTKYEQFCVRVREIGNHAPSKSRFLLQILELALEDDGSQGEKRMLEQNVN